MIKHFGTFFILFLLLSMHMNAQTFELVWYDEFNGTGAPDSDKWGYELGYIRNKELQYYTNSTDNARQINGNLEIVLREETIAGYDYTSGSITTETKADFLYGKIEGRFKVPASQGLWAVFWAMGSNIRSVGWPSCGEIDILEHINNETIQHANAHWADANGDYTNQSGQIENIDVTQWHTYSIIWDSSNITYCIDDIQYHQVSILDGANSTQEFHLPQYILINLCIGGKWPGPPDATTVLPATLYCDYIRVYKEADLGTSVNSELERVSFSIFPNPVEGNSVINLKSIGFSEFDVSIFRFNGQLVYTKFIRASDILNIELPNLSSGIYFIKLNNSSSSKVQKLIIK